MNCLLERFELDAIGMNMQSLNSDNNLCVHRSASGNMETTARQRPEVVIVGGGFGGISAAQALAGAPVNITLIDKHNYHLFQPLLYQAATAALNPAEIASPIRNILRDQKNVTVYMDTVSGIDKDQRRVHTDSGRAIPFDFLILATGARHSYFNNDHWAEYAPGLKSLDDAMKLRHRILHAFEQAEMETDPDKHHAHLTFVIIGGGPTGVEMAGAIAELGHSIAHDFRTFSTRCARVILVEAGDRVLAQFAPQLSERTRQDLESIGVEVMTGIRVEQIERGAVLLNGKRLSTETVIWAAGVQASPAGTWLDAKTDRAGRVQVNRDCSLAGYPEIFVIGDTAAFIPEGSERPLPGVAPVAKQQGRFVGKLIGNRLRGKRGNDHFRYRDYGSMATIGRNRAIADLHGLHVRGIAGWFLWSFAHILFIADFRNRLRVALSWLWAYLTYQRGSRLITGMGFNIEDNDNEKRNTQSGENSESGLAGWRSARRVRMGSPG